MVIATLLGFTWEQDPDYFDVRDGWTHEVELGDVDGDGHIDVILVNGEGYSTPGDPQESRLFLNPNGGPPLVEVGGALGGPAHARTAKVRDFDGDGDRDVLLVLAYGEVSRLLDNVGGGTLVDVSSRLPQTPRSFGDGEPLDIDGDGDLDVVLADWGPGDALRNAGGPVVVWRNDGAGTFTEDLAAVPVLAVGMSWDLEGADVDGDFDLDVLVSCKTCDGSVLLLNDGTGLFTDVSSRLPQRPNNYDVEVLDLDDDGLPEVVTVNDGRLLRESVWTADAAGTFTDVSDVWIPGGPGADDNVLVTVDYDDDGDRDVIVGSLSGDDRVFVDDGATFVVVTDAIVGPSTPGTLGLAAGDLDEDGRVDLVMGQGEVRSPDFVFRGVDLPVDTHPPVIGPLLQYGYHVVGFAHDRISPVAEHDVRVVLRTDVGEVSIPHAGGGMWVGDVPQAATSGQWCAVDRLGLESCSDLAFYAAPAHTGDAGHTGLPADHTGDPVPPIVHTGDPTDTDTDPPPGGDSKGDGCDCSTTSPTTMSPLVFGLALALRRRRLIGVK